MFNTNVKMEKKSNKAMTYLVRGIVSLTLIGIGTAITLYGKSVWKNRKTSE